MKKNLQKIILSAGIGGVAAIGGFAYLYHNGLSGQYANTKPKKGQIKVACVGDSITYGHGIRNWKKNNYPAILQNLLGDKYHVANFGSSGACINPNGDQPYGERAIYKESLAYEADILIFMLGTNDSKPKNWINMEYFIQNYMNLLGTYLKREDLPKVYIGLCSKAYFLKESKTGIAEFDIQPTIVDEIAKNLERIFKDIAVDSKDTPSVERKVSVPKLTNGGYPYSIVDIHSLTEVHPEWFREDGIHPNNDGAKAIAKAMAKTVKNRG